MPGPRPVGIVLLIAIGVALVSAPARAQEPVDRVATADAALDRLAAEGTSPWPTFRVDTIPIVWSFPDRGWALTNWIDDTLPSGFDATSIPGVVWKPVVEDGPPGANMVSLGERGWAFVPAGGLDPAGMIGLGAHEAFHVWQAAARREGRYRRGENTALMIDYPEFDAELEARFALEGRLLAAALESDDPEEVRDLVWRFVAAREARHRALGPDLAAFEENTELNEGVAQYVYLKAIERAGENGDLSEDEVAGEVRSEIGRLGAELVADGERSLRRRFYTTGSALGRLLDATAGKGWKDDLVESGLSLHGLLARASGYRAREDSLVLLARESHGGGLDEVARTAAIERRDRRLARVEEVLSTDGLRVEIASPYLGLCGFDPQNLLRLADDRLLHARWIRFCLPDGSAEFDVPVVQDREAGTAVAVLPEPDGVEMTVAGEPVELDSPPEGTLEDLSIDGPGLSLEAARARVSRRDGVLEVTIER